MDGTFYWYGENKEKTTGENALWHWGVRCYSSQDLYNWKDEGIIIQPDLEDKNAPMHPESMMDRPHIIYNEKTKKYVAWMKIMGEPSFFHVMEADHILGPYHVVNKVNPHGEMVGDLNEEYTDAEGDYSEHFPHEAPPDTREAPSCSLYSCGESS